MVAHHHHSAEWLLTAGCSCAAKAGMLGTCKSPQRKSWRKGTAVMLSAFQGDGGVSSELWLCVVGQPGCGVEWCKQCN